MDLFATFLQFLTAFFIHYITVIDIPTGSPTNPTNPIRTVYEYYYEADGSYIVTARTMGAMVNGVSTNISVSTLFDFLGRSVEESDGRGFSTHYQYDLQNRITRQINPNGTSVNVTYDTPNNRITITNRNAANQDVQQIRRNHDQLGRLTSVYAHDGTGFIRLADVQYDNIGRKITETAHRDASNFARETFTYDGLDRIASRSIFDNSTRREHITFAYAIDPTSAFGVRNTSVTAVYTGDTIFRHPTTVSVIDQKGRTLSTTMQHPTTGAILDRTDNVYDFVGNLTSTRSGRVRLHNIANPSNLRDTVRIEYNHMNLPVREYNALDNPNDPNNRNFRTFNYDNIGRLISESDFEGRLTRYTYDNAGRLIQVQAPFNSSASSNTHNYFDANGNLTRTRQQNNREWVSTSTFSTVEYAYDNMNRLTQVTQHDGANRYLTQYAFEDGFNMTQRNVLREELATIGLWGNVAGDITENMIRAEHGLRARAGVRPI